MFPIFAPHSKSITLEPRESNFPRQNNDESMTDQQALSPDHNNGKGKALLLSSAASSSSSRFAFWLVRPMSVLTVGRPLHLQQQQQQQPPPLPLQHPQAHAVPRNGYSTSGQNNNNGPRHLQHAVSMAVMALFLLVAFLQLQGTQNRLIAVASSQRAMHHQPQQHSSLQPREQPDLRTGEEGGSRRSSVEWQREQEEQLQQGSMRHQQPPPQLKQQEKALQPIRQISILGERNSGTRWTYEHIKKCFGRAVSVQKRLTRYKHWFQYPNTSAYLHDTLVLAQFRNPYDWLKAMEHVPHHSPNHLRTARNASTGFQTSQNDWLVFLSKPWTMPRAGTDLDPAKTNSTPCQEGFLYRDIISCDLEPWPVSRFNYTIRYSEHQPFYEMRNDGSGLPYDNIMELRTDKIRNFLSVKQYPGVADVWVLQYEYLLYKGTDHLVQRIAEWTGVTPRCKPAPPQQRRPRKSRSTSKEFARYVRAHLNWTVERMIGYEPDPSREDATEWR